MFRYDILDDRYSVGAGSTTDLLDIRNGKEVVVPHLKITFKSLFSITSSFFSFLLMQWVRVLTGFHFLQSSSQSEVRYSRQ